MAQITGKAGRTLDMDRIRTFRWTIGAMEAFEDLSRDFLLSRKMIAEDSPVTTRMVLNQFIKITTILKYAVASALRHEDPNVDAGAVIDAFLENGGDLDQIEQALLEAFWMTADPSYLPIYQELVKMANQSRQVDLELAKAKMQALQSPSTATSPGSPGKISVGGKRRR